MNETTIPNKKAQNGEIRVLNILLCVFSFEDTNHHSIKDVFKRPKLIYMYSLEVWTDESHERALLTVIFLQCVYSLVA